MKLLNLLGIILIVSTQNTFAEKNNQHKTETAQKEEGKASLEADEETEKLSSRIVQTLREKGEQAKASVQSAVESTKEAFQKKTEQAKERISYTQDMAKETLKYVPAKTLEQMGFSFDDLEKAMVCARPIITILEKLSRNPHDRDTYLSLKSDPCVNTIRDFYFRCIDPSILVITAIPGIGTAVSTACRIIDSTDTRINKALKEGQEHFG